MKGHAYFLFGLLALAPLPASAEAVALKSQHAFSFEEARERVQLMLDYWKQRYGVQFHWSGHKAYVSGKLFGIDVDAVLEVNGHEVSGEFQDPGPFLRHSAQEYLQKKLHKYLHPEFQEA